MIKLNCIIEVHDVTTLAEAQRTLDAFREAVQPASEHGLSIYQAAETEVWSSERGNNAAEPAPKLTELIELAELVASGNTEIDDLEAAAVRVLAGGNAIVVPVATVRGQDVYINEERFQAFDSERYANAFALGYNEAVENGAITDAGRTNADDQDWNNIYDAGRNARIDAEGLTSEDEGR